MRITPSAFIKMCERRELYPFDSFTVIDTFTRTHGVRFNFDKHIPDELVEKLRKRSNVVISEWRYRYAPEIKGVSVIITH